MRKPRLEDLGVKERKEEESQHTQGECGVRYVGELKCVYRLYI